MQLVPLLGLHQDGPLTASFARAGKVSRSNCLTRDDRCVPMHRGYRPGLGNRDDQSILTNLARSCSGLLGCMRHRATCADAAKTRQSMHTHRPTLWHSTYVRGLRPVSLAGRPGYAVCSMNSMQGPRGDYATVKGDGPSDKILLLLRHGETHMNVFLREHPEKKDGML